MLKAGSDSNDPFEILKTTKDVLQKAKSIELLPSKINKISELVGEKLESNFDENEYGLGLTGDYETDVQLLVVEDTVNFCFWAEKNADKWKVEWPKGNVVLGGWYGLLAVFKRALAENLPILEAEFLANLTLKEVKNIFRSVNKTEIPLLQNRLNNLIETGEVLLKNFDGKFINLVEEAGFDGIEIVKLVYDSFPSFRDEAEYNGEKVYFLKRAQILANDLSYITKNGKRIEIKNLDKLTAFADYKIPQMLRHFGVVKYSKELAEKVDNYEIIPALSSEEIEIRAAMIQGVDLIKQNLKKYTASQIDNALWLLSQDQSGVEKPYHRTYTIYY